MKKFSWLLFLFLMFEAGLLLYANRGKLTEPYDASYWKDRYDHSQWQLPLSTRTLGDNGLYAYEGYELVRGADPTKYNAEIPPLGKYAIGAVIRLTGNSAWYGVMSACVAALLFFLLSKRILNNTTYALIAVTWLSFDRLFTSQWTATMLDMLQLSALLLFFTFLGQSTVFAGIALGVFSAIKYPVFLPVLLAGGIYYLWKKTHSPRSVLVFVVSAAGVYVLSYARYFLSGHTFLDWLRVQKWMFAFWTGSTLQANIGSVWTTLLANRYQNLFTGGWESVSEWSLSWPVVTALSAIAVYRARKHVWLTVIGVSVVCIMLVYTFIPFWTRYLLLVIPFLYIGAAAVIRTIKPTWVIPGIVLTILGLNAYTSWYGIFPTPEEDVKQFVYDWKNGFFQNMYERFTLPAKEGGDRYVFQRTIARVIVDGEIENTDITILPVDWKQFVSPQYVSLNVTYSTRHLGKYTHVVRLPVVNENGLWRIPWKPEYLLSGFTQGDTLKTTVVPAKRGAIINESGTILAQDIEGVLISITPEKIDSHREKDMLTLLETIFGYPQFSAVAFYHRYIVNSQPDWPIPIAIVPPTISEETLETLRAFPGITITPALARYQSEELKDTVGQLKNTHFAECCSYLYTTTTYDGVSGLEKTYNTRLKGENGGSLMIIDSAGNVVRTILTKEKKDGEDVLL